MKNIFSNLAAFCLGLSVCVAIIACANDTDDYTGNSIEKLSEQIIKLSERVKELEKSSILPKVVSAESYHTSGDYKDEDKYDFTFDNEGRITKVAINETITGEGSSTRVYNVIYSNNQCVIKRSAGGGVYSFTLTFDADDIRNVRAVNNMIVSYVTL